MEVFFTQLLSAPPEIVQTNKFPPVAVVTKSEADANDSPLPM